MISGVRRGQFHVVESYPSAGDMRAGIDDGAVVGRQVLLAEADVVEFAFRRPPVSEAEFGALADRPAHAVIAGRNLVSRARRPD
jgi:hypothetical protein